MLYSFFDKWGSGNKGCESAGNFRAAQNLLQARLDLRWRYLMRVGAPTCTKTILPFPQRATRLCPSLETKARSST